MAKKQIKSIVTDLNDKSCFICGWRGDLALHHMIHGQHRQKADIDGLTCWLCPPCHSALHDHGFKDKQLQAIAEQAWLKQGHTVSEWISRYSKNYL